MFWHPVNKGATEQDKGFSDLDTKTLGTGDTAWLLNALDQHSLSDSGIKVGPTSALGDPRVLCAVQGIAFDIAKVPLNIYRKQNKRITIPYKSPLWKVVRRKPCSFMTSFDWKVYIMFSLLLQGNSYCYKEYTGAGMLKALIPINPSRVTLFEAEDGDIFYRISGGGRFERSLIPTDIENGGGIMIPAERIWHQKYLPQGSGLIGATPITLARNAIGVSLSQLKMSSSMAKSGAKLSGVIKHPKRMRKGTADRVRAQWANNYEGVEKAGRTAVLEEGMEFQPISMSAVDAQFIEQMKFSVLDICRIFRITPTKMMDLSRSTYNNNEQESLSYVTDTLMPHYERFEESLNVSLLSDEQAVDHYFEFDISRLTRGDTKAQVEQDTKYVQNGIVNRNEVRERLARDPYDHGNEFLIPQNMAPATNQPPPESEGGQDDG